MINAEMANAILDMMNHRDLGSFTDKQLLVVIELRKIAKNETKIYIRFDEGHKVDGIKAIRCATGLGLREAKEKFEEINPDSLGELFHITTVYDGGEKIRESCGAFSGANAIHINNGTTIYIGEPY